MKKVILIPDSFKGTMSSSEICHIMKDSITSFFPEANIISIPVADGGEGSVDAFLEALGGEKITCNVKNPYFENMQSFYGSLPNQGAIIEMASCAGLPLVIDRLNPLKTTTYGVGELINNALENGCTNIIVGLGGSCTNDGGCGAASALGVKFFDKENKEFIPTGGTLINIEKIDISNLNPQLKNCTITTMCDIDNPLYGTSGAAYVFAPQKGANKDCVEELDKGLIHLANIVKRDLGVDYAQVAGAGAAGGMGFGMLCFLNSPLKMGIEIVLDTVNFDKHLENACFVFSGEGKIDTQSLRGKVIMGVANRTKKAGVKLISVVGDIGDDIEEAYDKGVTAIFSINRIASPFEHAKLRARNDLKLTMDNVVRFVKSIQ